MESKPKPYAEGFDAYRFMTLVAMDAVPADKIQAIHIVHGTTDTYRPTIPAAIAYYRFGRAITYLAGNIHGMSAEQYRSELLATEIIDEKDLHELPVDPENANTRTEALALVAWLAQRPEITNVLVASTAHHGPRAFATIVTAVEEKLHGRIKVYSRVGEAEPYDDHVVHCQGSLEGTYRELMKVEWERLAKYRDAGHILLVQEILEYWKWRDSK